MGDWHFATATAAIDEAAAVLATRATEIEQAAGRWGCRRRPTLETAYEAADARPRAGPGAGRPELATEARWRMAGDRASRERPPLTVIGLLGRDPDGELAAARAAFSSGDLDAADGDLAAVNGMLDGAVESGRERVAVAGLAGAGVIAIGGAAVFAGAARPADGCEAAGGGRLGGSARGRDTASAGVASSVGSRHRLRRSRSKRRRRRRTARTRTLHSATRRPAGASPTRRRTRSAKEETEREAALG